jgi:hypothetical protein
MKFKVLVLALVALMVLAFALPLFAGNAGVAVAAGPGDCDFGGVHSGFAQDGKTGQGPNRGGHVPGGHNGASGFCGVGGGG